MDYYQVGRWTLLLLTTGPGAAADWQTADGPADGPYHCCYLLNSVELVHTDTSSLSAGRLRTPYRRARQVPHGIPPSNPPSPSWCWITVNTSVWAVDKQFCHQKTSLLQFPTHCIPPPSLSRPEDPDLTRRVLLRATVTRWRQRVFVFQPDFDQPLTKCSALIVQLS